MAAVSFRSFVAVLVVGSALALGVAASADVAPSGPPTATGTGGAAATVETLASTDGPSRSWTSTVVSVLLSLKYGSSGTPTQTATEPPPGSAACSVIGDVRRLTPAP